MTDPSSEMQKIDQLMAELRKKADGTATVPGTSPPSGRKRKKRGGLLDLIAVAMAIYTMVVTTPVGGLVVRTFNWMTGAKAKTRPLIAYFETEGTSVANEQRIRTIATAPKKQSETELLAKKVGLAPEVAHAVVVIASSGNQDATGHYDVRLPPGGRASLSEIKTPFPSSKPARDRQEALIKGVAALEKQLKSAEAAVAAIAVELPRVRYAVERARASGTSDPVPYEALRAFLPPEDRDDADNLVHGTFALAIAYDLKWPVDDRWPVTSGFGYREHPILGGRRMHNGTDLGVPSGTEVRAMADGIVLHATSDGVNGLFVEINHGHGLTSAYCHNSNLLVSSGDRVRKGARISKSGSTGRSSGPHLHFQLEIDGRPVDPELFRQGVTPVVRVSPLPSMKTVAKTMERKIVRRIPRSWRRTMVTAGRRLL